MRNKLSPALSLAVALALASAASMAANTTSSAGTSTAASSSTKTPTPTAAITPSGATTSSSLKSSGTRPAPSDAPLGTVVPDTSAAGTSSVDEDFVVGPNGERIPVNRAANAVTVPAGATPELDAAMRKSAQQTRKKLARKEQLMHSITPRTNNDKTDQMPDDPISPTLSLPAEAPKAR